MTAEGLFERKIRNLLKGHDDEWSVREFGAYFFDAEKVLEIVEEAKAEFPNIIDQGRLFHWSEIHEYHRWFLKWFGSEEEVKEK